MQPSTLLSSRYIRETLSGLQTLRGQLGRLEAEHIDRSMATVDQYEASYIECETARIGLHEHWMKIYRTHMLPDAAEIKARLQPEYDATLQRVRAMETNLDKLHDEVTAIAAWAQPKEVFNGTNELTNPHK